MSARGAFLLNPMNLMEYSTITWQGQLRPTADPEGRLCQFDTFIDGIRAGTKNLLAYFEKDGCNTVRKIITRYAPPPVAAPADDNNTDNYIQFVCKWIGVGADDSIDMTNSGLMQQFVAAIIHFEQSYDCCTTFQIQTGVQQGMAAVLGAK